MSKKRQSSPFSKSRKVGGVGLLTLIAVLLCIWALRPHPVPAVEAARPAPTQTSAAASKAPKPASLAPIRNLVAGDKDLVISIFGDSTGNGTSEWPALWAAHLAKNATVELHLWDSTAEKWHKKPITFGDGPRLITIYNGSHPGGTPGYARQQDDLMQPKQPDLIITNYGHNGQPGENIRTLRTLLREAADKWGNSAPVAVTVQNVARDVVEPRSAKNRQAMRVLALNEGYPVIDVELAFENAGTLSELLVDMVHPNGKGQQVWLDAVTKALG